MRRVLAIALLLAQALPGAAQNAASTPPAATSPAPGTCPLRPIVSTHTIPPYPTVSQATGEQGTTVLRAFITKEGTIGDDSVEHSSGSLRLDDAALDYVKENWRWQALPPACGAGVTTLLSIVWNLKETPEQFTPLITMTMAPADYPEGALARLEQGNVAIMLVLSGTGQIMQSRVTASSGFTDLDARALQIAQTRWTWTPPKMSGEPVKSVILLNLHFAPPAAKN